MKILIVGSLNSHAGKFAPFIVEQADALRAAGCEIEYYGVTRKGIKGYLQSAFELRAKIEEVRPDVIHAHFGLSGLMCCLQRLVPVVVTYHGSDINLPKNLRLSRLAMRLAAWNIFVSKRTMEIALGGKSEEVRGKNTLIPCGINLPPVADDQRIRNAWVSVSHVLEPGKKHVLFAGAFDNAVKDPELAKAVVEYLNKNIENSSKIEKIDVGRPTPREENICLDSCPDGTKDSVCFSHTSSKLESVSINHNPEDESSQLSNQIKNCSVPTSHKIAQSLLIEHKMESLPTEHKMEPAVAEIDYAKVVNGLMGKNRVRDIKTSFRDGAIVIDHPTIEQVREYYAILRNLYTTKVKTPLFPLSFFEKLYEQKDGRFILVGLKRDENEDENEKVEIIGGTVCVAQEGRCLYEWFVAGRDGEWKTIFPSSVATYAGIRYAAENGMPRFDMMGAGKPGDAYGVRDFKARFGGELVEQGRYKCICKPLLYKCGELGVKLLKKIK